MRPRPRRAALGPVPGFGEKWLRTEPLRLGGPPVIVFFLGSPLALEAGRASIVAAFLAMDVAALPAFWALGLFGRESLHLGVMSLPVLVSGVWLGARIAQHVEEAVARKVILVLLMLLALGSFV